MATIQQAGLEKIQLNLRPAGATTTIPLANMIVLDNLDPAMPADLADRDYSAANNGTFTAWGGSTKQAGASSMQLDFTTLSYRDLNYIFEIWMQGGVSPTETPPASGLWLWPYGSQATSDDLARAGIQAGGDIGKLQAVDMLGSQLTITGSATTGKVTASGQLLGSGSPTDEASFQTPIAYDSGEQIQFGEDVSVFIDDTAGNIGNTRLDCELVKGFTASLNNSVSGVDTTCGKQYGRNNRYLEFTIELLMGQGAYDELLKELSNTIRYIQLYIPNDPVPASATAYWKLNVAGFWKPYTLSVDGPFRSVALTCWSQYDETLAYDWFCELLNDVSAVAAYQP